MEHVVAETTLTIQKPNGNTNPVHLEIGLPYTTPEEGAACPISMTGLFPKLPDVHGADTFQALALAVDFVRIVVTKVQANGCTFLDEGEAYRPEEIWFSKEILEKPV